MDKSKRAIQEIQKGIINYTKKEISYAPYDKTKTGIISSIKDDNLYEIKIDNKTYDNVPTTGGICTINETVRVVVPQNNFNNIFILKSGENESSSGNVESVNGKTGTVILDASDVKALPSSTTIPTKTSDLTNDSNFISSIPNEYVTDTEMQSYAQPIGDYATNKQLDEEITRAKAVEQHKTYTLSKSADGSNIILTDGSGETASVSNTYTDVTNKPSINGVEISGNRTFAELGEDTISNSELKDIIDKQFNLIFGGN